MFGVRTQEDAKRSQAVLTGIRELYRVPRQRVPVSMHAEIKTGKPSTLTVSDGIRTVCAEGAIPETAQNAPLTGESVRRSLCKTGGTPFRPDAFECNVDDGLRLSASALNGLRREALDALYEARTARPDRAVNPPDLSIPATPRKTEPRLCVRFASAEQLVAAPEIAYYSLPVDTLENRPDLSTDRTVGEIPILVYPDEEPKIAETLKTLKQKGLRYALAENIGAIRLAKEAGLVPVGGAYLNVMNSDSLDAYRALGVSAQFASFELSAAKTNDLGSGLPLGMIVAGRLPLMHLRSCPARTDRGCAGCQGSPVVSDRKGATFPLVCRDRRYSTLLNSVPLYLADKPLPPLDFYAVYLTNESRGQAGELIRSVLAHESPAGPHTTGLAFRKLL